MQIQCRADAVHSEQVAAKDKNRAGCLRLIDRSTRDPDLLAEDEAPLILSLAREHGSRRPSSR